MTNLLSTAARQRLLKWFERNARPMPWRLNRDPYRIWVSEVMLQQTQVAAVIPYFERFLSAFPTVQALAAAPESAVLRHWEGLGYYRRARHLHRAAGELIARHNGNLPDDPDVWAALPGVGRYILGAVLSQAYDRRLPIVEANTKRLLCRLTGELGDPQTGEVNRRLWDAATTILPRKRVGDFNQALMELGSQVCTPNNPRCGDCPLQSDCMAFRNDAQDRIPTKTPAPTIEKVNEVALVIRKGKQILLVRRPATGRWANMWEFPHIVQQPEEPTEATAERLLADLGIVAELRGRLPTIEHAVTRFRIVMNCLEAVHRSGKFRSAYYVEGRWLAPTELPDYPMSVPQRRLGKCLVDG